MGLFRQLATKNHNNLLAMSSALDYQDKREAMSSTFAPGSAKQEC